jgi:hypothetical protein
MNKKFLDLMLIQEDISEHDLISRLNDAGMNDREILLNCFGMLRKLVRVLTISEFQVATNVNGSISYTNEQGYNETELVERLFKRGIDVNSVMGKSSGIINVNQIK